MVFGRGGDGQVSLAISYERVSLRSPDDSELSTCSLAEVGCPQGASASAAQGSRRVRL